MIEVNKLSLSYGKTVVFRQTSFQVKNGTVYGIYGDNKSGKSTLLALLAGALLPDGGSVRINGFDTAREPLAARRCVGYLPQAPELDTQLTVYELLELVAQAKGVPADRRFLQVHEILEQTSLSELRDRLISYLSPVDQRLLGIAQALIGSPEILLLDDPTCDLTGMEARTVRSLIRELTATGKTVFYATSNPQEILHMCHEVLLIEPPEIRSAAPLSELLTGNYLVAELKGEPRRIEEILSASGLVAACRRLGCEGERLCYRFKTASHASLDAITALLGASGIEVISIAQEEPSALEAALRQANDAKRSKSDPSSKRDVQRGEAE